MTQSPQNVAPADGKLGILCVGLGAVTSTLIAGVELAKKGMAQPIGSLTEMGTIRLGKRTDGNVPAIRDFVPLAGLDDIVFGAWDPFPDDAFVAAQRAGVLESGRHIFHTLDRSRYEPIAIYMDGRGRLWKIGLPLLVQNTTADIEARLEADAARLPYEALPEAERPGPATGQGQRRVSWPMP